jgi:2-polyprenyl-3-methyl-5-hydroxy-6-metoxy-1,4-benzoquinol methylase
MSSEYFDRMAASWDENPARRGISMAVAAAIGQTVKLDKTMTVLDYGCGTGLLSFLLAGKVGAVVAADSSEGMLGQVTNKIVEQGVKNVQAIRFDVTCDKTPLERYDVVTSAMTMHHIEDVHGAMHGLDKLLKPGGWLAVADLCSEDGSFHQDMKVPHNGFEPQELVQCLSGIGMTDVSWRIVHKVEKNDKEYPIFCVFAKKS